MLSQSNETVILIFILLVVFQVKHFLADYPLQNSYMLGKFKSGWDFVGPLTCHCLVHATFTFMIVIAFTNNVIFALKCCCIDFIAHFIVDRIKANPKLLGKYKTINDFEYGHIKQGIDRAVEAGAIHDCWKLETHLHERLKSTKRFWSSLGLDQAAHHLTHYFIIYLMVSRNG